MDDNRKYPRYPLHLKVVLHLPGSEHRSLHGETLDISLDGTAILTEHNVFTSEELLMEVHLPPEITGRQPKILKIKARMIYTLYSTSHYCFRSGLLFHSYQENALALLKAKLHQHLKLMD